MYADLRFDERDIPRKHLLQKKYTRG